VHQCVSNISNNNGPQQAQALPIMDVYQEFLNISCVGSNPIGASNGAMVLMFLFHGRLSARATRKR